MLEFIRKLSRDKTFSNVVKNTGGGAENDGHENAGHVSGV